MKDEIGEAFVINLLSTLAHHGVTNTLPITTHLHTPSHPGNNLCLSRLRPRGVCCAYSGVGECVLLLASPHRRMPADSPSDRSVVFAYHAPPRISLPSLLISPHCHSHCCIGPFVLLPSFAFTRNASRPPGQ